MKQLKKMFSILAIDISVINRRVFNLPFDNVSLKEITLNKHIQNLVWSFCFGRLLHKKN